MKPPKFEYHAPTTMDEALWLLHELRDDEARILAGGQSLVPLLNMRLARPRHLIDVNGLHDLCYIREDANGGLAVGALTRHRALEQSPEVAVRCPLLAEATPLIGDRIVRCRGTLGGSLAHADPSAELPVVALALDAQLVLRSAERTRTVQARDFFLTYFTTALEPDEMLTEVRFPSPGPGQTGYAFLELTRQHGAFAIVSVAAGLTIENGRIRDARLAVGGIGGAPFRAQAAEQAVRQQRPGAATWKEASRLVSEACDPDGDVHGSAEYRREMAGVYAGRALELAAKRAVTP